MIHRLPRSTTSVRKTKTYPAGILHLDTDEKRLYLHDGVTPGGTPLGKRVALLGPTQGEPGAELTYRIVNYDHFTTYGVAASDGVATITDDTITLTLGGELEEHLYVTADGMTTTVRIDVVLGAVEGTVVEKASGPPSRTYGTLVQIERSLYLYGGRPDNGVARTPALWRYDIDDDSWTELTSESPGLTDHRAFTDGVDMYVFGGFDGNYRRGELKRYTVATDTWETVTTYSPGLVSPAVTYVDGSIYVSGGYGGGSYQSIHKRYDIADDVWTDLAPCPTARAATTAVHTGGKLYSVGGFTGSSKLSDLYVYDIAEDTWTVTATPVSVRRDNGLSIQGDYLYVIGGDPSLNSGGLWRYQLSTETWEGYPGFPLFRGSSYCEAPPPLWVFGGLDDNDEVRQPLYRIT